MTGLTYQNEAMRTYDGQASERLSKVLDDHDWTAEDIGGVLEACLGLAGEVGEVNDLVKKTIFHEAEIDTVHLMKEVGDICWYIALICHCMGWDLEDVMQANIDKLKNRYPEGFDPHRSAHRKEGDV